MQSATLRFDNIDQNDPAVANVIAFTGGGGAANGGFIFMALKPLEERKIARTRSSQPPAAETRAVPGASLFLQAGQDLRIGGRQSNAQYQYTIQSENLDDLVKWGPICFSK
jgi:multidrug efflux pump